MQRAGIIMGKLKVIVIMLVMMTLHACEGVKSSISVKLAAGDTETRITEITPAAPKAGDTVTLTGKRFPTRTKNLIGRVVLADGATKDSALTVASDTSVIYRAYRYSKRRKINYHAVR